MEECIYESESDSPFSDDSQNDPSFDFVEETRLTLSDLSLTRKSKRPHVSGVKEKNDEEVVEEFDVKDEQSYETIQKMIEVGQVDRLKVEQCKIYLRKNGLRLSGKKDILIQRIKEHVDIANGGGEKKYPASSFVLNCKGDCCKGDIVMFEQNVYEEFSIASRSSNGGPCGKRIVAGRILKESYGAAKQQHTFTIEVLWSRGEKPLPPLHPLLIKGRNLYRLNTMRQKWEDEGERHRILLEKHTRGDVARSTREARIQQKEMRKMQRACRVIRNEEHPSRNQERREAPHFVQQGHCYTRTQESSIPTLPVHQRQPLMDINRNARRIQHAGWRPSNVPFQKSTTGGSFHQESRPNNPIRGGGPQIFSSNPKFVEIPAERMHQMQSRNTFGNHQQGDERRKICPYFGRGRCYFGDRCKYLHASA